VTAKSLGSGSFLKTSWQSGSGKMKDRINKPKVCITKFLSKDKNTGAFIPEYRFKLKAGNGRVMFYGKWYGQRWQAVRAFKIIKWIFQGQIIWE
jgi:uncharacterized protein YegP (UPF0339 family)